MFSQTYLDMLKSTVIKYMDEDKIFAYSPFSNREEQMDLSIAEKKGKVIIFDTRTSYINATQLVDAFKDKPFKEFCKLTKTKNFKELIDYIEDEINKDPHPNKKFQKYPNWDNKGKYFKALYLVRPSSKNIGYAGTYVHPDLIIHVLVWCNNKLSSKISKLITSILLHEGADETVSLDTVFVEEISRLNTSVKEKEKIIETLKTENKELIDQIDSNSFDIIQYHKTLNYLSDVREENAMLKRALDKKSTMSIVNQAIIIIGNYDNNKCKYGSKLHKLTLLLIDENDLEKYVNRYSRHDKLNEEQLEEQLANGEIEIKTDIILKIISLRGVPQDFIQNFVSIYEDQIDVWLERVKTKQFLMTTEIENFKDCFVEYIGDWMVI